jgi:CRP-like cAMP-binding protein
VAKTSTAERVARLRAIPLFSGVSDGSLGRIGTVMTEFEAAPGQVLMQQAHPGSGLLVVEEGTVVVEGPGKPPVELGPGEFLGELALLTSEGTHTARVRAKTSAVLLAIGRADFARLIEDEPKIAIAMLSGLAARLAGTRQNA